MKDVLDDGTVVFQTGKPTAISIAVSKAAHWRIWIPSRESEKLLAAVVTVWKVSMSMLYCLRYPPRGRPGPVVGLIDVDRILGLVTVSSQENSKSAQLSNDIIRAIQAENERLPRYLSFIVESKQREGDIWKVFVRGTEPNQRGPDSLLEGAAAWWPSPVKGAADVLSVIAEESQINLRFSTSMPPGPGERIRIYLPQYLGKLEEYYADAAFARSSLDWFDRIRTTNNFDYAIVPNPLGLFGLRKNQEESFQLIGRDAGFLWGPPGTGKTYTLGCLLASLLAQQPSVRILLLSTTNSAVDLALLAVDDGLKKLRTKRAGTESLNPSCKRIGSHYIASHYDGREHLLPTHDVTLVRQLIHLEADRPERGDVKAYAEWVSEEESTRAALRARTRDVLEESALVAMTTTRAVFDMELLREFAPFDALVFDESSQISIAHALAIAPLGRKVLFTGDPKQLAPIVRSDFDEVKEWMGRSMMELAFEPPEATVMLTEQSRMAEPICRIVSNVFYGGDLVVAKGCHWDSYRKENKGSAAVHVGLLQVEQEGAWSRKYHGPIRFESAKLVADTVSRFVGGEDQSHFMVLTPFRAQRRLIREFLKRRGLSRIRVSTVHRAQGSECLAIIFDPVDGGSDFLRTPDAERLINVAISRAEAMLFLVLSPGDRQNPLLERIAVLAESAGASNEATPISQLVGRSDFPACVIGEVVRIGDIVARGLETQENGRKLIVSDLTTGERRTFFTVVLRRNFAPN